MLDSRRGLVGPTHIFNHIFNRIFNHIFNHGVWRRFENPKRVVLYIVYILLDVTQLLGLAPIPDLYIYPVHLAWHTIQLSVCSLLARRPNFSMTFIKRWVNE